MTSTSHTIKNHVATISADALSEPLRISYLDSPAASSTKSKGTILLIHGFPQISHQFRHVIPSFSAAGYRVIAPDYRGAGLSSKPHGAFTKTALATDLHTLLHSHLKITEPVHVVGHDIGGMVAHAYAARFRKDTASVIWGECPLPGSSTMENAFGTVAMFHFVFHQILDLPETLVLGKEREYVKHFFDKLCYNAGAFGTGDVDVYADAYSRPGAMRCGFGVYRAFEQDGKENREWREREGKCKVRCLLLSGEMGPFVAEAKQMGSEFYEQYEVRSVEGSGHWIAEENPEGFVEEVLRFVQKD